MPRTFLWLQSHPVLQNVVVSHSHRAPRGAVFTVVQRSRRAEELCKPLTAVPGHGAALLKAFVTH